ncbi:unnamed protein product, partial [Meganyctiphanes norvegica]
MMVDTCNDINPKISSVDQRITNLTTVIDNVTDGINTITSEIIIQTDEIALMKSNITDISLLSDTCNIINPKISSVDQRITNLTDVIGNVSDGINTITSEILIQTDEIAVMKSNITEVNVHISKTLEDIKDAIQDTNNSIVEATIKIIHPRNCEDIFKQGIETSEPVQIFPYSWAPYASVSVLCDQEWTIIQRRQDVKPRENFTRPWADYAQGFGETTGEYWLGLDVMHRMTQHSRNELYIELEDWEGNRKWAKYAHFSVGPPKDNYKLTVTGYTGDAGDSLRYHNGRPFSTFDNDNDSSSINCAEKAKGGWWYGNCAYANLNGRPDVGRDTTGAAGISWYHWLGDYYSLRSVKMKIKQTPF